MTTNRKRQKTNRVRDFKKEVTQQGNATKGGKKAKTKQRARTNKARRQLGLKKGDPREAVHAKPFGRGKVRKGSAKQNAKNQPKRT